MGRKKAHKVITAISAIIILAVFSAAAYYFSRGQKSAAPIAANQTQQPSVKLPEIKSREIFEENGNIYSIDIEYPQIGVEKADKEIKEIFESQAADFKKEAQPYPTERDGALNSLYARYEYNFFRSKYVNFVFSVTTDTGGAHPFTDALTLIYDFTSGQRLFLKDLFLPETDYLTEISRLAIKDLQRQLASEEAGADQEWLASGAGPSEVNFKNFVLTEQGVKFIFPPYQVAPYAAGEKEVLINFIDLRGILRPEFR